MNQILMILQIVHETHENWMYDRDIIHMSWASIWKHVAQDQLSVFGTFPSYSYGQFYESFHNAFENIIMQEWRFQHLAFSNYQCIERIHILENDNYWRMWLACKCMVRYDLSLAFLRQKNFRHHDWIYAYFINCYLVVLSTILNVVRF